MSGQELYYLPAPPLPTPSSPPPSVSPEEPSAPPPTRQRFDPSRMIGIIRRKALVRDLAAVYHAECLTYCQGLLELQRKSEESYVDPKLEENSKKEAMRAPPKRRKITR